LEITHILHIPQQWEQQWVEYKAALTESHIRIVEGEDEIIWALAKLGKYSPKEGYLVLVETHQPQAIELWWKHMWKLEAPPRTRLLMWTILKYKIPTGDNLIKHA